MNPLKYCANSKRKCYNKIILVLFIDYKCPSKIFSYSFIDITNHIHITCILTG